ncbi:MAG: TonB-dependent receptor, partial [Gammaproteobacteria bacterium]|jgi:outer membrane receptor protein involved in Fe transport|nr:TonB-dependent receptor [Gammaproteobacteria bacterium]
VQDVPIAVDIIDRQDLFRRGVRDLNALTLQVPSLELDQGSAPQDLRIGIRGLSPTRGRPNVAILLDGIDISSEALVTAGGSLLIDPALFDLERVEVVKGPQSALYGRSAFAGAISYITRLPDEEFRGSAEADFGQFGQQLVRARVSGSLGIDGLTGGLNGAYWSHDGFYNNPQTGADIGGREGYTLAGTIAWSPDNSNLSVIGRVSFEDSEYEIAPYAHPAPTAVFDFPAVAVGSVLDPSVTTIRGVRGLIPQGSQLSPTNSENPRTGADYPGTEKQVARATLTITNDFDDLPLLGATRFTSLTHYADTSSTQFQDFNAFGSAAVLPAYGEIFFDDETTLFSQELRLQSNGDGPFNWVVGALFWQEQVDLLDGGITCLTYAPPFLPAATAPPCGPFVADVGTALPRNADRWVRDTDHWSAYALLSYAFAEGWEASFEARQVSERLEVGGPDIDNSIIDPLNIFGGGVTLFPAPAGINRGTNRDSYFAPKATLRWQASEDQTYYVSIAEGIKPSGISTVTGGVGAFNPDGNRFSSERVIVYELGAKTDWLDGRLRVNSALFWQDFTDKQVTSQLPDVSGILRSRVVNADAEVYGFEFDATWLATDHSTLQLAYTFLDTEYTDFPQLTSSAATIAYTGNCELVTTSAGQTTCRVSFSGNELERAPRHAAVGLYNYTRSLNASLDWYVEGQATYRDERFTNPANLLTFDSYWLADFRVGILAERWELTAYVNNAFDDDTVKNAFNTGGYLRDFELAGATFVLPDSGQLFLPDPRRFGIRALYRFGG